MPDDIRAHKRLLRDLLRLLRDVERCHHCVPPADAYDGRHSDEWARLRGRIVAMSRDEAAEKAPN